MAQAQKTGKQPQDPYAQRGKVLASAAKRLQGWVGSDPSKGVELADALVALTGHRLLGHGFAAAAADATEAVRRSAEQLTVNGPLGPYTAVDDAVRFVTAVAHLATVQVGLGRPDAAGRTIAALPGLRDQLTQLPLAEHLDPSTAIYILAANARAALATDDPAGANAYADAALSRRAEAGLTGDDVTYLRLDVDRLAADARWAAGRAAESLTHLHAAKDGYHAFVAGRLNEPGRLPPALVERLAEPLFGLYSDLADRLVRHGDTDLGLVTRRELIGLLRGLVKPAGQPARMQLSLALGDLAHDLERTDRLIESEAASAEAAELASIPGSAADGRRSVPDLGSPAITWSPLSAADAYAATTAVDGSAAAPATPDVERQHETAAWLVAERAEAHRLEQERLAQARAEAEQQAAEQAEAERVAAAEHVVAAARAADARRIEIEQQAAAEEADRRETKRRREERLEQHRIEVERREAERRAAAGEPPVEPEPEADVPEIPAPVAVEVAEPVEPEVAQPLVPQVAEPLVPEVAEPWVPEVELAAPTRPAEPDAVAMARQAWQDARARGERRAARAALEAYVELLRPRAQSDLAAYGPTLVQALEELSSARLRGGDLFGSRAPAKEARALARTLNST